MLLSLTVTAMAIDNEPTATVEPLSDVAGKTNFDDSVVLLSPHSVDWPTTAWDIENLGKYSGEIRSLYKGYSLYTNYYFLCSPDGKLEVKAELTAEIPSAINSECIIRLYNAITKKLVVEYSPGREAYDKTTVYHVFTNLETATPYVVKFTNASSATFSNPISGPIYVDWP